METNNREQWFVDRIGKKVFRNKTTCDCKTCENVYNFGLIISDKLHADYLCMCEEELNAEGVKLKYFDSIEERNNYENK